MASAFVRYRVDGGRVFVFNIDHIAAGQVALGAPARAFLARADHLHVMGSSLSATAVREVVAAGIASVKGQGGTNSFDPNVRPELLEAPGMGEALQALPSACDIFLPPDGERFLFTEAREGPRLRRSSSPVRSPCESLPSTDTRGFWAEPVAKGPR